MIIEESPIDNLLGHSITYRIATGPREGQKVFTLQTLPAELDQRRPDAAECSGFSLHAGIAAKVSQRNKVRSRSDREGALGYKLERLARYVSRPPVATDRLALTANGQVRYALTNRQDCRFVIARLAALVPKPRAHLTRYHGVFAPASPHRAWIVPGAPPATDIRHRQKKGSRRQSAIIQVSN